MLLLYLLVILFVSLVTVLVLLRKKGVLTVQLFSLSIASFWGFTSLIVF